MRWAGSILGGLEHPEDNLAEREIDHRTAPRTTDEHTQLLWQVVKCKRELEQ